jgi:hypothetical protein|tara:strand:+ start:111 stop:755 length:645 start_codon:yes stop_codon:yes gene_type:complete
MARKITSKTDNKGWTDPSKKKVRKKRKPMTEDQKAAAAERLEKARAARAAKNPDYGMSGIHESLRDLPADYPITPKKVKGWIKTQKELASAERRNEKANMKGATARKTSHEAYVRNLQKYLKDGDYVDTFYGEHQEKRIGNRCLAQAYYWEGPKKGEPKFDVGTYYPLLGTVYSQEMYNADNGVENADVQNPKKRRKYTKRSVEGKTKKRGKAS